jgi:hypothetical protein
VSQKAANHKDGLGFEKRTDENRRVAKATNELFHLDLMALPCLGVLSPRPSLQFAIDQSADFYGFTSKRLVVCRFVAASR